MDLAHLADLLEQGANIAILNADALGQVDNPTARVWLDGYRDGA